LKLSSFFLSISLDKPSILAVIGTTRQISSRRRLDASQRLGGEQNKKAAPWGAASKEAGGKDVFSGKAMQGDEVQARARTLVLEVVKNLEEG
jgi:hypothetical protein